MKSTSLIALSYTLIKKAFFNKLYGFISLLSIVSTITGYNIQHLIKDISNPWFDNYHVGGYILTITLSFLFIRYAYVATKELYDSNVLSDSNLTPVKFSKQLKFVIFNTNKLIDAQLDEPNQNKALSDLCDQIKYIFDKITKSNCCVSIKLLSHKDINKPLSKEEIVNLEVINLVRDRNHSARDTEKYKETHHIIRENTAFNAAISQLNKTKQFYLNNNVDLNNGYITTSPLQNPDDEELPYKSELVFPIVKNIKDNTFLLRGFLCIDSDKLNSFRTKNIEIELCEIFSHSLFNIIPKLRI